MATYRPYIYVASRDNDGLVKPGYSWEPEKRIRRFGQNTPEGRYQMSLLFKRLMPKVEATVDGEPNSFTDVSRMEVNAKTIEKKLREVFIDYHIRGEWFKAEAAKKMVKFLQDHPWETFRTFVVATSNGGKQRTYAWNQIRA